ncbi:MAG: hypothetical protein ACREU5_00445 [Burkholderiales bacterium]
MAKAKPAPRTAPAPKAPVNVQPSVFASVVFLKIHDFARRPVVEQARLRAQLEAVMAVALQELREDARLLLDAADGVALVVLDAPRAALALAQRTLAAGAVGLPLAIGINHGPVKLSGKGKSEGLMGDGIAVAAGIAELASAQKLLLTRDFRLALEAAAPGAEAALAAAGTHTDPSLRAHELFQPDPRGTTRRSRRYLAATVLAVILLIGAGLAYRASLEGVDHYAARMKAKAIALVQKARGH